jgi:3-phenylpropionate/trans-cinnamate dioxygenase ferredoxin reductase subunit
MRDPLFVIGGGQAGFAIISKLRKVGDKRAITIISNEQHLPYQRPPLSKKYLLGEKGKSQLFFRPQSWYDKNDIKLKLGVVVEAINKKEKSIHLRSGERYLYKNLALTTGSRARALPEKIGGLLKGVYSISTLNDVDVIKNEFIAGRTVLVIGGGYIGLEAAATASKLGLHVVIIEQEERILKRVAAEATSDYFRSLHTSHGVRVFESTCLKELIEKNGRVVGARMIKGNSIAVDFVICGIGVEPNDDLARGSGLEVSNGIVVDEYCKTSDPNIIAAGDCASFLYKGKWIRLESVQNAMDQGEAAAETIIGNVLSYKPYPWFWSDQFEVKLQIAGLNLGFNQTFLRKSRREGGQSVWYYKNDSLIAVDAMNDGASYLIASRLLKMAQSPRPEQVKDTNFDLKSLL